MSELAPPLNPALADGDWTNDIAWDICDKAIDNFANAPLVLNENDRHMFFDVADVSTTIKLCKIYGVHNAIFSVFHIMQLMVLF